MTADEALLILLDHVGDEVVCEVELRDGDVVCQTAGDLAHWTGRPRRELATVPAVLADHMKGVFAVGGSGGFSVRPDVIVAVDWWKRPPDDPEGPHGFQPQPADAHRAGLRFTLRDGVALVVRWM